MGRPLLVVPLPIEEARRAPPVQPDYQSTTAGAFVPTER